MYLSLWVIIPFVIYLICVCSGYNSKEAKIKELQKQVIYLETVLFDIEQNVSGDVIKDAKEWASYKLN